MKQRKRNEPVTTRAQLVAVCWAPEGVPVDCDFVYDPADPYAMAMVFRVSGEAPNRWTFARDLLLEGLEHPAGEGDVRAWPSVGLDGRAEVAITLASPDGELELRASRRDVVAFVTAMLEAVPEGQEGSDWDEELSSLFR